LNIIGAFIVLITGYWMAEGLIDLPTILWFLFGVCLLIPEQVRDLLKFTWGFYERK
jgi:hypothetical protein